jgi:hypothetical protein
MISLLTVYTAVQGSNPASPQPIANAVISKVDLDCHLEWLIIVGWHVKGAMLHKIG